MPHSTLQFGAETVTKTSAPEEMRVEVEKTRLAFAIGQRSGLFTVPEVLDYDEEAGVAVFRRLEIRPVSKAVPWGPKRRSLARSLGRALAVVHRDLTLPEEFRRPLPSEVDDADDGSDHVYLHGDLSVNNVCVGTTSPDLTILDWQMTPLYGSRATHGTRFFDLFWFVNNLVHRPYTRFLVTDPVAPVADAFLESYFDEARVPYDSTRATTYARKLFGAEVPRVRQEVVADSWGRARMLLPASRAILRDFISSL